MGTFTHGAIVGSVTRIFGELDKPLEFPSVSFLKNSVSSLSWGTKIILAGAKVPSIDVPIAFCDGSQRGVDVGL